MVKPRSYIPRPGDIVWLDFSPQVGRGQSLRRPAVVLSDAAYNAKVGLMVCCPMARQVKGYPYEVVIGGAEPGAILADQIKNLDWRARRAERKGRVKEEILAEIRGKIKALIGA